MEARLTPARLRQAAGVFCAIAGLGGAGCGKSTSASPNSSGSPPQAGDLSCDQDASDWPMFGQNVCNTGSQAAAGGISTSTVGTLGPKWVVDLTTVYSGGGDVSATPTVTGGYVYVPDWGGNISKFNANTGSVVWTESVGTLLQSAGVMLPGFASRGAPVVTGGLVIFGALRGTALAENPGRSAYVVAIDDATGAFKWATLVDPHPAAIIAGSPVVDGNTLYIGVSSQEEYYKLIAALNPAEKYTCCSFRGSVVALNVQTGSIVWKAYSIADSLYYPGGTPADGGNFGEGTMAPPPRPFAGAAIWSSTPVIDRKRSQIYVTTGNNYLTAAGQADSGANDGNYVDSVMAIDETTGTVKWARSFPKGGADIWTTGNMSGADSDFGAGANLFTATIDGVAEDLVGAGQKSGTYWALDANTGATVWSTLVGPGGHLGGIHWGTATDGTRVYMENNLEGTTPYKLAGSGPLAGMTTATGIWSAIDTTSGEILWQVPNPALWSAANGGATLNGASCNGPVAVTNGVLFAGSMDANGTMFAFNAATGDTLWQFPSGGTVYGGPAIANGTVYWGCGYPNGVGAGARPLGFGSSCHKLYAFGLGLAGQDGGAEGGAVADAAGATDAASSTDAAGSTDATGATDATGSADSTSATDAAGSVDSTVATDAEGD
jgi:polyvinyl alcohol dehydrogenase (cytochrome)